MTANADALRIGENAGGGATDRFAGDIDDVRIYNKELPVAHVQALYNRGFAAKHGHYHLRADNNNRVVALLNESAAATRVQPAFEIDNWYGTKTPKYVYLNGTRLVPNVDYRRGLGGVHRQRRLRLQPLPPAQQGADRRRTRPCSSTTTTPPATWARPRR